METMSHEQEAKLLTDFQVVRMDKILAITTPIPDDRGNISKKTPIYQLPVYQVKLVLNGGEQQSIQEVVDLKCDLADMTDLIGKLKEVQNDWRQAGLV